MTVDIHAGPSDSRHEMNTPMQYADSRGFPSFARNVIMNSVEDNGYKMPGYYEAGRDGWELVAITEGGATHFTVKAHCSVYGWLTYSESTKIAAR